MSSDYTPTKVCSKCGIEKPATTDFFHRQSDRKDGLRSWCKDCFNTVSNERYHADLDKKEHSKLLRRLRYQDNREKELARNRRWAETNPERRAEISLQWSKDNPERRADIRRRYNERHREELAEKKRKYLQANPEKIIAYREANRERIRDYHRHYRQSYPEVARVAKQRRRARKRDLPDTFTGEQWVKCLEYHHYCCAVCGAQLRDLFGDVEPHADHWIPVSYEGTDNPGTVAENMVCLCNGCNRSKSAKMPDVWLVEKYGKRKAAEILVQIHAYFEQVKLE